MKKSNGGGWIRPRKRWAIYHRDGFACVYCGEKPSQLSLDHVFPRNSPFRDNDARRLVTCCFECNNERGSMRMSVWMRHLRDTKNVSLEELFRKLQTARYVPLNRRAGDRALAKQRALCTLSPPEGFEVDWDKVPF